VSGIVKTLPIVRRDANCAHRMKDETSLFLRFERMDFAPLQLHEHEKCSAGLARQR
jgi:hypothetical protein